MTPRRLLALWRERWGKEPDAAEIPYLPGGLAKWGRQLAYARAWGWPGVGAGCAVLGALLLALFASVRFPLDGQVFFSAPLLVIALFVTRWGGTVTTLTIVAFALLASARYLSWRLFDTLDPELGWEFALGFGLWAAELVWFITTLAGKARTLWPLRRDPAALPEESFEWPSVDLLLLCDGHTPHAIGAAVDERGMPEWPKKKLKLLLLDGAERAEVRQLAEAAGAVYLAQPGRAEAVNAALGHGKGELVAIVDCGSRPDRSFLVGCAGWFAQERRFGMLQTHDHFLAPPASARVRRMVEAPHAYQSFALVRRAALEENGGVELAAPTAAAHTALKLQALGYGVAYAGVAPDGGDGARLAITPRPKAPPQPFRVDFPFGRTVLWKERVVALHRALNFYHPVPRMVFLLAPALGLIGDARLIQASFTLYFAYVMPHLLHVHVSQARMRGHGRLAFWIELREIALSWYMLALTAVNLIPVLAGRWLRALKEPAAGREPFDWSAALPYLIAFGLNAAAIGFGFVGLFRQDYAEPDFAVLYLLWSLYNVLLLAAMLAVAEEARHIRLHVRLKRKLPVMVKLASRRTVSGVTRNFPESQLVLDLNAPYAAAEDDEVHLSLFSGGREYDFPARIVSQQNGNLTLRIERAALQNYHALAAVVFARGADWPEWLPHRGADHPVPAWISKPALAAFITILDWTAKFARLLNFSRMLGWIQKWKKS